MEKEKTICKCGHGCDYDRTYYEKINDIACNNSVMISYRKAEKKWIKDKQLTQKQ